MSEQRANSFSIIEVLQYVRKNGETGCLTFEDNGKPIAELYFNKGHLIHAQNGKVMGDDVVYQLLGNRTARIRWDRTRNPAEESVSKTDEMLLLGALGILTEEDASGMLDLVSREAEEEMASAFEAASAPAPTKSAFDSAPTPSHNGTNGAAMPSPNGNGVMPITTNNTANQVQRPPANIQNQPTPTNFAVSNNTPEINLGSPTTTEGSTLPGSTSRLTALFGDEVLRPPRFKRWNDLPLPFPSAYAIEPEDPDRYVKSVFDLLWEEKFSGFLSVVFGNNEGLSMMFKGRAIHTRFGEGKNLYRDQNALRRIIDLQVPASEKNSVLVYPLAPEFVHSYTALLMGETLLNSFSSQGMKINKLLNTLEHSHHTGVVRISNDIENGFMFLSDGHKLGSYYEVENVLEESILRVYQIVSKAGSLIDVLTSPDEDKLFQAASRPRSAAEIKQQLIEIAQEILGKRANRVVNLIAQAEDNAPSLKTYCNQARRVTQMFIDKGLADQLYERFMFLIQELN